MNNKTVLVLVVVLILIGGGILWKSAGVKVEPTDTTETTSEQSSATPSTPSTSGSQTSTKPPAPKPGVTSPSGWTEGETNTNPGNVTPDMPRLQVNYTDQGFLPISVIVQRGQEVRFMNQGKLQMWLSTNGKYAEFDQVSPVSRGEYYDFVFLKAGTYTYYNKADTTKTGTIIVK